MPSVTRASYYSALVDRRFAERPHRRGTATSSGSTTTLVDTKFTSSMSLTSPLTGCWIRVETGGTVEYAIISSVTASTGTLTLDRAVTSTTTSTNWWITYGQHPIVLENVLNQVLRNIYVPGLFPLTSFILTGDDNDMQASGTSAFSNTSGTLAKSTTRFFPTGSQSLSVTATATPGYAYLASDLAVNAGHSYTAGVLMSCTTGDSGEFRIVDVDNSNAAIENATGDEIAWSDMQFQFTPPTNCERINAFLVGTTNTDVVYFQDFFVRDLEQRIFTTPSWLIWPSQILGAYTLPRGSTDPSNDFGYRTLTGIMRPLKASPFPSNIGQTQELMVQIEAGIQDRIYLYAMRPATALSTDSSSSYLDTDAVVENCLAVLEMPPSKANQYLRVLRERTLNSNYSAPQPKAMAWYG